MKRALMLGTAILMAMGSVAFAAGGHKPLPANGSASANGASKVAPGQRALSTPEATDTGKDYAPGRQVKSNDDRSMPGASEYAPGQMKKTN